MAVKVYLSLEYNMVDMQYPTDKEEDNLTTSTVIIKPRKPMSIFKANLDDGILPEWEPDLLTIDELINELCFDNPSFKDCLEEAKRELATFSREDKNRVIDNVFRRIE